MTAPNEGAPGPTAIGTRGQEKQQHRDSDTTAVAVRTGLVVPLPDLAAVQALVARIGGAA